ncbi:unnamed protein product [Choristocarpus tenellus]
MSAEGIRSDKRVVSRSEGPSNLRLATYNVHGLSRFSNVLQVLRDSEADVVALQEVSERGCKRLVEQLGWADCAFSPATFMGNGIISRFPLEVYQIGQLQSKWGDETRSAAVVTVLGLSTPLRLCATHLDHVDERARMEQAQSLLRELEKILGTNDGRAFIVAGDFNALTRIDYSTEQWKEIEDHRKANFWEAPQVELMEMLRVDQGFEDAKQFKGDDGGHQDKGGTSRFGTRIDYIFRGTKCPWSFVPGSYKIVSGMPASDHNLVRVDVQLETGTDGMSGGLVEGSETDAS